MEQLSGILPLILIFVVFYFLLIRPQQKKLKSHKEMITNLKKGDKVVMWYYSGNRDESMFENANAFDITRSNARNSVSFGFGVHRCLGMRLAELQMRILWQEILARWTKIEIVGDVERVESNFVNGYSKMPVRIIK